MGKSRVRPGGPAREKGKDGERPRAKKQKVEGAEELTGSGTSSSVTLGSEGSATKLELSGSGEGMKEEGEKPVEMDVTSPAEPKPSVEGETVVPEATTSAGVTEEETKMATQEGEEGEAADGARLAKMVDIPPMEGVEVPEEGTPVDLPPKVGLLPDEFGVAWREERKKEEEERAERKKVKEEGRREGERGRKKKRKEREEG